MIFAGKTALVTGSSRGIGRSIALALADEGADVVVTYVRRRKAAEAVAAEIMQRGRVATVQRVDVTRPEQIDALFDEIEAQIGHLDIFVSNAVSATIRPLATLPDRHWDRVMEANLGAFFRASRRAATLMEGREGGGRIVGVSSIGSRVTVPGYAALGVAKAGMEVLARYMAVEWADRGINVNVACGGPIDTEALSAFSAGGVDLEQLARDMRARTPAGRLGRAEDLARLVIFLCSPASDWVRGQTIVADGGLTAVGWRGQDES